MIPTAGNAIATRINAGVIVQISSIKVPLMNPTAATDIGASRRDMHDVLVSIHLRVYASTR